ncbi:MAG: FliH/SctL family protein [Nitrospirota bacterium]
MAKKSFSKAEAPSIQPYTPLPFDEEELSRTVPAPQEGTGVGQRAQISEEEQQARLHAQVAAREKEGYEKGYETGFAKGSAEGRQEMQHAAQRLEAVMRSLEAYKEKGIDELAPAIVALSLEIAKKIIHKEVELDREVVLAVAQDALKRVGEKEESVVIKVNPLDYEVMISQIDFLKSQSGIKGISVEPYAAITPGGCYIETQTGEVDARIEEQLREVQDVISTATDREM